MTQFLFNVQNIKMLFILATGIYSWTFLRKQRKNNQQSRIRARNSKQLKEEFNKINFEDCNTDQMCQIFKGIEKTTTKKIEQPLTTPAVNIEPSGGVINGQNKINIKKQQQDMESQLNTILSNKLMERIKRTKTLKQTQSQWLKINSNSGILDQQQEYFESNCGTLPAFHRLKSNRENRVKIEDAICHVQLTREDEDFQYFFPIKKSTEMDMENVTNLFQFEGRPLKTNLQCLNQLNRIVPQIRTPKKPYAAKFKTPKKDNRVKKTKKIMPITQYKKKQNKIFPSLKFKTEPQKKVISSNIYPNNSQPINLVNDKKSQCQCKCSGNFSQTSTIYYDKNKINDQRLDNLEISHMAGQRIHRIVKTQIYYEFNANSAH